MQSNIGIWVTVGMIAGLVVGFLFGVAVTILFALRQILLDWETTTAEAKRQLQQMPKCRICGVPIGGNHDNRRD